MSQIVNRLDKGLQADIARASTPKDSYTDAVNVSLSEEEGLTALTNLKGTKHLYSFPLTGGQFTGSFQTYNQNPILYWENFGQATPVYSDKERLFCQEFVLGAFNCIGKYKGKDGTTITREYEAESIVFFTVRYKADLNPPNDDLENVILSGDADVDYFNNIYILNSTTKSIHRIFAGKLNMHLKSSTSSYANIEIDAFQRENNNDCTIYWTDNINPPRKMRLYVEDTSKVNLISYFNDSPLDKWIENPIANLNLYHSYKTLDLFRRYPVEPIEVDSILNDSGNILAGTYQFAYRLFNTRSYTNSTFSLFTNPLPIISSKTGSPDVNVNDIEGSKLGEICNKSIKLSIGDPANRPEDYGLYNSVQIAIIKNTQGTGVRQSVCYLTEPLTDVYSSGEWVYSGAEKLTELDINVPTIDYSPIETFRTLAEHRGVLYIANIKYKDLVHCPTIQDATTKIKRLTTAVDGIFGAKGQYTANNAGEPDYTSEMSCSKYRGYFRGEVYRFATTYVDEYGRWSEPCLIDFSEIEKSAKRDSANAAHAQLSFAGANAGYFEVISFHRDTYFDNDAVFAEVSFRNSTGAYFFQLSVAITSGTIYVLGGYSQSSPAYGDREIIVKSGTLAKATNLNSITWQSAIDVTGLSLTVMIFTNSPYKNWIADGETDWKFGPREENSQAILENSHIFEPTEIGGVPIRYIRAFGLSLTGISNHPEWAVGMAVVRAPRIKNILGQSPYIHGIVAQGQPQQFEENFTGDALEPQPAQRLNSWGDLRGGGSGTVMPPFISEIKDPRKEKGLFNYGGENDTIIPRILSHGMTHNLLMAVAIIYEIDNQLFTSYRHGPFTQYMYPMWIPCEDQDDNGILEDFTIYNTPKVKSSYPNCFYLYPLEYLANIDGNSLSEIAINNSEGIRVIDLVTTPASLVNAGGVISQYDVGENFAEQVKKWTALEFMTYAHLCSENDISPSSTVSINNIKRNPHYFGMRDRYSWVFTPATVSSYASSGMLGRRIESTPDNNKLSGLLHFDYDAALLRKIEKGKEIALNNPREVVEGIDAGRNYVRFNAFGMPIEHELYNVLFVNKINGLNELLSFEQEQFNSKEIFEGSHKWSKNLEIVQKSIFGILQNPKSNKIKDVTGTLKKEEASMLFPGSVRLVSGKQNKDAKNIFPIKHHWENMVAGDYSSIPEFRYRHWFNYNRYITPHYNPIVTPDAPIQIPIVNIEKGLGDNRYGGKNSSQEYIHTGVYKRLDGFFKETPIDVDVFGGDCYITRLIAKIRDNAPAKRASLLANNSSSRKGYTPYTPILGASPGDTLANLEKLSWFDVQDSDSGFMYGVAAIPYRYRSIHGRIPVAYLHPTVQSYKFYNEIIDVYVESEVNGAFLNNRSDFYPKGISKEGIIEKDVSDSSYYPTGCNFNGESKDINELFPKEIFEDPRFYDYLLDYSIQNLCKLFVSLPKDFPRPERRESRIAFSRKRVDDSLIYGYDEIYVDNSFDDLSQSHGEIVKIAMQQGDRMIVVQEKAIAEVMIGTVAAMEKNASLIQVRSGEPIGSSRYIAVDTGSRQLKSVKVLDNTLFYYDGIKQHILKVTDGVEKISQNRVDSIITKYLEPDVEPRDKGLVVGIVDMLNGQYGVVSNDNRFQKILTSNPERLNGLIYNNKINAFETRLLVPFDIVENIVFNWDLKTQLHWADTVSSNRNTYHFINRLKKLDITPVLGDPAIFYGGDFSIYEFDETEDRDAMFGTYSMGPDSPQVRVRRFPKESFFKISFNESPSIRKVFSVLYANAENIRLGATEIEAIIKKTGIPLSDSIASTVFNKQRENIYIANELRDNSTERRLVGLICEISIIISRENRPEVRKLLFNELVMKLRQSNRNF